MSMANYPDVSQNNRNYTTQNILILSGAALGSIIVLITIATLCDRFCHWRQYQNNISVANPDPHNRLCGLDPSVIASLPNFKYKSERDDCGAGSVECVVCLSMVQEGEGVRQLPMCKHLFHQECIDMWFYSHSTCPICRSMVAVRNKKVFDTGVTASSTVIHV